MEPVRWGILSTALIGMQKVIPAMLQSPGAMRVIAIASRDLARAERAAASFGIDRAYGSYEALFDDPDIEVVYNPLPNHLHVPLTLAAAQAGKHVLCEKPMALNAAEAEMLRPYASKVHIREALHGAPASAVAGDARDRARWRARRAAAHPVPSATSTIDPTNVRNLADIGGGALYDIGCYPIVTAPLHLRRRAACG